MEYVIGPVLALLVSMKFTVWKTKPPKITHEEMIARIEQLEEAALNSESEVAKKVLKVSVPLVQEINKIKTEIGI